MTTSPDVSQLRAQLALIDTDLADAGAALAGASTADWVSTSADLFRGELSDAQRRMAAISGDVVVVRTALARLV